MNLNIFSIYFIAGRPMGTKDATKVLFIHKLRPFTCLMTAMQAYIIKN